MTVGDAWAVSALYGALALAALGLAALRGPPSPGRARARFRDVRSLFGIHALMSALVPAFAVLEGMPRVGDAASALPLAAMMAASLLFMDRMTGG